MRRWEAQRDRQTRSGTAVPYLTDTFRLADHTPATRIDSFHVAKASLCFYTKATYITWVNIFCFRSGASGTAVKPGRRGHVPSRIDWRR
jgi:hypothetical protein